MNVITLTRITDALCDVDFPHRSVIIFFCFIFLFLEQQRWNEIYKCTGNQIAVDVSVNAQAWFSFHFCLENVSRNPSVS